jgi:hypothetical protein
MTAEYRPDRASKGVYSRLAFLTWRRRAPIALARSAAELRG